LGILIDDAIDASILTEDKKLNIIAITSEEYSSILLNTEFENNLFRKELVIYN